MRNEKRQKMNEECEKEGIHEKQENEQEFINEER